LLSITAARCSLPCQPVILCDDADAPPFFKRAKMKPQNHIRLLILVSIAWLLFWLGGCPEYYQQYSITFMVIFDLAILPPICYLVFRSVKNSKPGRALKLCLWWSFYISVPLFFYDLLYCGFYLGHSISFLWKYWYLSIYYVLPWVIFPPMGWLLDKRHH